MSTVPVLSPDDVRHWDAAAVAGGRTTAGLMLVAGRAVAQLVLERWRREAMRGVLIATGSGQNGGDGWEAARALHALCVPVRVVEAATPTSGAPAAARALALSEGVPMLTRDAPWPSPGLVVDALLGTGATGAPRPDYAALLHRLHDLAVPFVAIDGPTGLDLATGLHHGEPHAAMTITFGGVRRGHLLARDAVGDLLVVDIGLGRCELPVPQLIDREWAAARLPRWAADAHKGTRGRVVIVGGAPAMVGAARFAARGAFAAGAGVVHLVAPEESLAVVRPTEPDVQTLAHPLHGAIAPELTALLQRADTVVIGPGLGRDPAGAAFVLDLLAISQRVVLDADALVVLRDARAELAERTGERPVLCTPHPGEFRTLFPELSAHLELAPWDAAAAAARALKAAVLLKGVPSVVAGPDTWLTIAAGNPGLATGGSGDVLAGVAAALMAQGLVPATAAAVAAQALGEAADHAARRFTARTLRPTDVLAALPATWRAWAHTSAAPRFPVLRELIVPWAV